MAKEEKKKVEKQKEKETPKKVEKAPILLEKGKTYIYIGDNMATGEINLIKNTVIKDITPILKALEKDAELKSLFLGLKEYAKIKNRLRDPNYRLNRIISKRRRK